MNKWFFVGVLLIIGFVGYRDNFKKIDLIDPVIKIGGVSLNIEVADTDTKRTQGLSGKTNLSEEIGLLFVFEKVGDHGIWMKGMLFPIDIAWFDANKRLVHLEENVSPDSYPRVFRSPTPALYVLETAANFFSSHNIKLGTQAEF